MTKAMKPGAFRRGQLPLRGCGASFYVGKRPGGGDEAGSAADDGHGVCGYLQLGAEGSHAGHGNGLQYAAPGRAITTWTSFSGRAVSAG